MSKITEIKKLDITVDLECDCGTIFKWHESTKGDPKKNKDTCPKCGIKYGLVLTPKKIKVEGKEDKAEELKNERPESQKML